jgi:hypothetical protein
MDGTNLPNKALPYELMDFLDGGMITKDVPYQ